MNSKTEKKVIHWREIAIELRYVAEWSKVFTKTYGEPLAHLEFRTISPSAVSEMLTVGQAAFATWTRTCAPAVWPKTTARRTRWRS